MVSEFAFTLLRFGYLALLWVFVLFAIGVLRRDLSTRAGTARVRTRGAKATKASPAKGALDGAAGAPRPAGAAAPAATTTPRRLAVIAGPLTGTSLPLSGSSILLGRAPGCTLVLDDDFASSRHARIFPHAGAWFLEDLGSTNGTFIGEHRIEGAPVELHLGVGVQIGRSVVELQG